MRHPWSGPSSRARRPIRGDQVVATTILDILSERHASSTDERDKGDEFERLMAAYLQTDVSWGRTGSAEFGCGATGQGGCGGLTRRDRLVGFPGHDRLGVALID